ncbi:MAG: HindIII family type II restriction endonuclease [Bacteroidia bacterium]|nr:HindIII family type II restriction endonuclease [Bacteroidia bacterium]
MDKIISAKAIKTRQYWIEEIRKLSGHFGNDTEKLEKELEAEIKNNGVSSLIDHLRLCGNIPESYGHDTNEEKLYSKYTDCLLSLAYSALGLKSLVFKERADAADVEAFAKDYSFVADAKAFRLSRTAKNQKDFKVQAMHGWKRNKPYAMVVCPIYQLPTSSSQIYQQATKDKKWINIYYTKGQKDSYMDNGGHNWFNMKDMKIRSKEYSLNSEGNHIQYAFIKELSRYEPDGSKHSMSLTSERIIDLFFLNANIKITENLITSSGLSFDELPVEIISAIKNPENKKGLKQGSAGKLIDIFRNDKLHDDFVLPFLKRFKGIYSTFSKRLKE